MRILVVDDEAPARLRLRELASELGGCEVVGEASTGREALHRYQALEPDVVLLDIHMPNMDGLEAAQHLTGLERPPAVIFTTAYGDYALAAFEAHAMDYLVKLPTLPKPKRDQKGESIELL
jgi:Response regulator of the LytR/AlgR family